MTKTMAAAFAFVGLMLLGGGIAYGFAGVNVIASDSCGNAFSAKNSLAFTASGSDACAQARSERKPMTLALLTTGGIALVCAVGAGMAANRDPKPAPVRAEF